MKLLVTGGTTFVSKYTAEYFVSKGHDVTVMNRGSRPQVGGVTLICCDRTDCKAALEGRHFDAVLDITAYNYDHIEPLLDSGVSFDDYIMISSSAVYPETNPQPFTEDQPTGRNSVWGDYGANKIAAEKSLLSRVPSAYILRPPYLYGKYNNVYREAFVFDCADAGRKFYIPRGGEWKLQFLNVRDLCRFMELILDTHPEEHIFNVGDEPVTVKDWVTLCYKLTGKEPEFVSVSGDVFARKYFCFFDYEYELDCSKMKALMPDSISLADGLREGLEYYRKDPDSIFRKNLYMEYINTNLH